MSGNGWWQFKSSPQHHDASPALEAAPPPPNIGVDVAYPMQHVMIRWHTLDGGEVSIPGQILSVDGEIVSVWFNRNVDSYNPLHADDRVWLDTYDADNTFVFAGWLMGMRPPDTLVINIEGLPRRDQRRQYVRELVTLPSQVLSHVDKDGEPVGDLIETTIRDLSGGGVRLEVRDPIEAGTKFLLTLDLDGTPFDAEVTIVDGLRSLTGAHIIRGYFSSIAERDRRVIIRYVFREQVKKARLAGAA